MLAPDRVDAPPLLVAIKRHSPARQPRQAVRLEIGWLHHRKQGRTGPVPQGAGPAAFPSRAGRGSSADRGVAGWLTLGLMLQHGARPSCSSKRSPLVSTRSKTR